MAITFNPAARAAWIPEDESSDCRTSRRVDPDQIAGSQVDVRRGLAPRHVVGRGPCGEEPVQSRPRKDEGYDLPRRRAGQSQTIARREARHRLARPRAPSAGPLRSGRASSRTTHSTISSSARGSPHTRRRYEAHCRELSPPAKASWSRSLHGRSHAANNSCITLSQTRSESSMTPSMSKMTADSDSGCVKSQPQFERGAQLHWCRVLGRPEGACPTGSRASGPPLPEWRKPWCPSRPGPRSDPKCRPADGWIPPARCSGRA